VSTTTQGKWSAGRIAALVAGVLVVIFGVIVGANAASIPGDISHRHALESAASHAYATGATYLATCETSAQAAVGLAQQNAAAFDKVISDAIAGKNAAGQFNLKTPTGQAGFFPLLVQAYPPMAGQTSLFTKAVDVIVGCQTDFRNYQGYIQDRMRDFDSWRGGFWIGLFGQSAPDSFMQVNLPGLHMTGQAAYVQISTPLVTSDTAKAYKNGTYDPGMFGVSPSGSASPASPVPNTSSPSGGK
jgi:hypothetical protein